MQPVDPDATFNPNATVDPDATVDLPKEVDNSINNKSIEECSYEDAPYLQATSNLMVPGLFLNFHTAATLLRIARSELKVGLIGDGGEDIISNFYKLLQKVEDSINSVNV